MLPHLSAKCTEVSVTFKIRNNKIRCYNFALAQIVQCGPRDRFAQKGQIVKPRSLPKAQKVEAIQVEGKGKQGRPKAFSDKRERGICPASNAVARREPIKRQRHRFGRLKFFKPLTLTRVRSDCNSLAMSSIVHYH